MKATIKPAIQFADKGALRLCVEAETDAERLVLFQLRMQLEKGGAYICERSEENGQCWGFSVCEPPVSCTTIVIGDGLADNSPRSVASRLRRKS